MTSFTLVQVLSGLAAPVAANRGASGIDGVLSTAAGFAFGLDRAVTLVVGDISFLHDINGLSLLRSGMDHASCQAQEQSWILLALLAGSSPLTSPRRQFPGIHITALWSHCGL